jgi:CubicO group peptidase (beta-lactamase class C family)
MSKSRLLFPIVIALCLCFLPLETYAEVKESEFGKSEGYPYAIGLPFRMIPKYRYGALTGKGLAELESKTPPFWIAPAGQSSTLLSTSPSMWLDTTAQQLMQQHTIMAMLLIKDGKVVFERYQYQTTEVTLFDSQSIAKTFTALFLGVLFDNGLLPSLDTKISGIVPELLSSPIGEASIRQTLQMQCGHEFKWLDDGDQGSAGKYARVKFAAGHIPGAQNLYDYFRTIPATIPGTRFSYDPHCSDAISMVISKLTGKTLRENFEEKIWQRIGTEGRAAWLSPSLHPELTSGANSFYARLRDYGRLALLFLNQGTYESKKIVSSAWIRSMHSDAVDVGNYPSNFKRYGYQTWVRTNTNSSWYAGLGNHGQRFYVDPSSKSAMIIFALDDTHIGASDKFWEQFRR